MEGGTSKAVHMCKGKKTTAEATACTRRRFFATRNLSRKLHNCKHIRVRTTCNQSDSIERSQQNSAVNIAIQCCVKPKSRCHQKSKQDVFVVHWKCVTHWYDDPLFVFSR